MFNVLFLEGNKPIRLIHVEIIIRKLYFWCLSSFFFVSSFIRQTNCPSTNHCHWHHYLCVSECPWTFSWPCTLINFLYLYSFFFFSLFLIFTYEEDRGVHHKYQHNNRRHLEDKVTTNYFTECKNRHVW